VIENVSLDVNYGTRNDAAFNGALICEYYGTYNLTLKDVTVKNTGMPTDYAPEEQAVAKNKIPALFMANKAPTATVTIHNLTATGFGSLLVVLKDTNVWSDGTYHAFGTQANLANYCTFTGTTTIN